MIPVREIYNRHKPAFGFLIRFLMVYVVGNLIYGIWIGFYEPTADPATRLVSEQTATVLKKTGCPVVTTPSNDHATVFMILNNQQVLEVFEGCNGLNVMIVFLAFMFAVGKYSLRFYIFSFLGLTLIHLINLLRISALFWVAINRPADFYFAHKYLFTAVLYVLIFLLWAVWLRTVSEKNYESAS